LCMAGVGCLVITVAGRAGDELTMFCHVVVRIGPASALLCSRAFTDDVTV